MSSAAHFDRMRRDVAELHKFIQQAKQELLIVAQSCTDNGASADQLQRLLEMLNDLNGMQQRGHARGVALDTVRPYALANAGEEAASLEDMFDQVYEEQASEPPSESDDASVGIKEALAAASQHIGVEMEGISAGDDDVVMSQVTVRTTCPITMKPLEDPVMCKRCKHVYEKAAIQQLVRAKRGCPVTGCTVTRITMADLVSDRNLKRQIERAKKAERLQAQTQEAEAERV